MMEIKKGYTLSQFVDICKGNQDADNSHNYRKEVIFKYNDFLKQSLTKDMFVNPYGKEPKILKGIIYDESFAFRLKQWKEAEKEVIFKGFNYTGTDDYAHQIVSDKYDIELYLNGASYVSFLENGESEEILIMIKTLGDLFQATNGELIIQNINL